MPQKRQSRHDDESEDYAVYGSRNAPRNANAKEVNYDENEAYDSMLSDSITDEEDDEDVAPASATIGEGDAIDGVFDHKRAEGRGEPFCMARVA